MSVNKDEQLAALKDLSRVVYHRKPFRNSLWEEADGASATQFLAEVTAAFLKLQFDQRRAEKRLLASGYPVPDHWLRLHTGEVDHKWERGIGDTISILDVDDAGLERAANEISLAILRLENVPATPKENASPKAETTDESRSYSVTDIIGRYQIDRSRVTSYCKAHDQNQPGISRAGREWRMTQAAIDRAGWKRKSTTSALKGYKVDWWCAGCNKHLRRTAKPHPGTCGCGGIYQRKFKG